MVIRECVNHRPRKRQNFELLPLEDVYGAIAYYLANQADIDAYLIRQSEKWAEGKRNAEPLPSPGRAAHDSRIVKVRFLADADLNRAIVTGVRRREPSLDFLRAQAAGLRGMNDSAVLALAAER